MAETAAQADQTHSTLLRNLVPINALSDDLLGQLISRISVENVRKGELIFCEGDTDHQHVYLLEGRVSLLTGKKEVDNVQAGTNTARFALSHQWPRKFSARATESAQVVRIDSRLLSDLLVRTQSQSYSVSELDPDESGDWMSRVLRSRVFQQIPASNIQNVLRRMERMEVTANQVIISEGDSGDFFYVIIQGNCRVTQDDHGVVEELARLGPGDSFGGEALVSELDRSGTVSMVSSGVLMRLERDDFIELIKRPLIKTERFNQAAARVKQGALWLDIRDAGAFAVKHLPEAVNMPLGVLREQAAGLADDLEYVVYGESTGDAAVATFLLRERGFEACILEGGIGKLNADQLVTGIEEAQERESGEESDTEPLTPENAIAVSEAESARVGELEQLLEDTQARFHKVLYQRVAELRKLKGALRVVKEHNLRLTQELENARDNAGHAGDDAIERKQLQTRVNELEAELDEVQEVLQEASAEESTHQWEKTRWQARQIQLEAALAEQKDINRVLREENEEGTRRLDSLGRELAALRSASKNHTPTDDES